MVIGPSKSIPVLDSPVFCNPCQTTGQPIFVYLASFYKTQKTLPYIYFIIFYPAHMGLILLYQFDNLLKRFGGYILYPNLLLD